MTSIIIIDDDESLTELLSTYLTKLGYSVSVAANGVEGIKNLSQRPADLVVLDVTMPVKDGWSTLKSIREIGDMPVIMLTARSEEHNILRGFSQGADDYITKPFSFAELAARVQAVLTRAGSPQDPDKDKLHLGDIQIDLRSRQVIRGNEEISLTPTEFKMLATLMGRTGEIVSSSELVREIWGPQYAGEEGHVRRYIWHLRKKLEPDPKEPRYVLNEHGYGYKFSPSNANQETAELGE